MKIEIIQNFLKLLPQRHLDSKNHKENLSVTLCFCALVAS